jgi:hypothetical protein
MRTKTYVSNQPKLQMNKIIYTYIATIITALIFIVMIAVSLVLCWRVSEAMRVESEVWGYERNM